MADENNEAEDIDEQEDGGDDLCDDGTTLEEHEIARDDELPAATGGVEE